jgi:hypothetical protein
MKTKTKYVVEQVAPYSLWDTTAEGFKVYDTSEHGSFGRAMKWIADRRSQTHSIALYAAPSSYFDVYAVRDGHFRHVARVEPYEGDASDWHQQDTSELLEGFDA